MKTRKFKFELAQKVYDLYRDPKNAPFNKDGTRFRGSQMSMNYWNGRDGTRTFGDKGSQAYAAWTAGVDVKASA